MRPSLIISLYGRLAHMARHSGIALFAIAAVTATVLLAPVDAHAQWKWRDAAGRIQLSDLPPPSTVPDKDILQRPGGPRNAAPAAAAPASAAVAAPNAAAPAARSKSPLDAELDRKKKADDQEKSAKAKADEERRNAQRADNCSRARDMLATMDSGQRISRVNAKGEREFLDDRQRAAEAQRARDIMASDCR